MAEGEVGSWNNMLSGTRYQVKIRQNAALCHTIRSRDSLAGTRFPVSTILSIFLFNHFRVIFIGAGAKSLPNLRIVFLVP